MQCTYSLGWVFGSPSLRRQLEFFFLRVLSQAYSWLQKTTRHVITSTSSVYVGHISNLTVNLTTNVNCSLISGSHHSKFRYLFNPRYFPGNQRVHLGGLDHHLAHVPLLNSFFYYLQHNLSMIVRKLKLIQQRLVGVIFGSPSATASVWSFSHCFETSTCISTFRFSISYYLMSNIVAIDRQNNWFVSYKFLSLEFQSWIYVFGLTELQELDSWFYDFCENVQSVYRASVTAAVAHDCCGPLRRWSFNAG